MDILGKKLHKPKESWDMKDYRHKEHLTQLLKIIQMTPMEPTMKMAMRANVWGLDPKVFTPLSPYQIQLINRGLTSCTHCEISVIVDEKGYNTVNRCSECIKAEESIVQMIEAGKHKCQEYLKKVTAQDAVNRFNANERKHKGQLFNKKKPKEPGLHV